MIIKDNDGKVNIKCYCGAFKRRTRVLPCKIKSILSAVSGGAVGLVTGMLGGGGGSLVVPLYESCGVDRRKSHATAIATILPLSIISGAIYFSRGFYPYPSGLVVSGGVIIGGVLGACILKRINTSLLGIIFYGTMIYAGIKMLS